MVIAKVVVGGIVIAKVVVGGMVIAKVVVGRMIIAKVVVGGMVIAKVIGCVVKAIGAVYGVFTSCRSTLKICCKLNKNL